MGLKTWVVPALILSGAIALAGGCGGSGSAQTGAAGRASADNGGSPGSGEVTTCRRTSECGDQVCSPDGRCVDCYDDTDCRASQHCARERCVSDASDSGGAPTEGGSGPRSTSGGPGHDSEGGTTDTSTTGGEPGVGGGADCHTAQVLFG